MSIETVRGGTLLMAQITFKDVGVTIRSWDKGLRLRCKINIVAIFLFSPRSRSIGLAATLFDGCHFTIISAHLILSHGPRIVKAAAIVDHFPDARQILIDTRLLGGEGFDFSVLAGVPGPKSFVR